MTFKFSHTGTKVSQQFYRVLFFNLEK